MTKLLSKHKSTEKSSASLFCIICSMLIVLLSALFILPTSKTIYAQEVTGERCVCVDFTGDGCACLEGGTNGGSFHASLGEVDVICGSQELASSFFNIANPVCGNNAETVPTCTGAGSDGLMCWGTTFGTGLSPSSIPLNSDSWFDI